MKKDFGTLPYSSIKIGDKFLVISNFGQWCSLSESELQDLKRHDVKKGSALFGKLKDNGLIIDKENVINVINDYKNLNRFLLQGPSLHIVVPTLRCNHECVYCHAKTPGKKNVDMNEKTAIKVLDFVFKTECPAVTIEFQGGEPLLNWKVLSFIVKEARMLNEKYEKKDLRITLVTNLTLMNEKKLDFLVKNNVSICTSLDGPENVHNMNRKYLGGGSTYKDVVKWIKRISEEYKKRGSDMKLYALSTITRFSLPYWKEIVDEYVKWDFDVIHLKFLNQLGAAIRNWDKISYSPQEFIDFWKKSIDYIINLNWKGVSISERVATVMLTKIIEKKDPGFTELMSPCGAGRTQLMYNYNGDIYTCDEGRMLDNNMFKLGNVNKDEYKSIIRSDGLISICYASVLNNYCECPYRPYCGTCPVMNYVEQGSVIPKITDTMRCKIYKSQFTYLFNRILENSEDLRIFKRWLNERENKTKAP